MTNPKASPLKNLPNIIEIALADTSKPLADNPDLIDYLCNVEASQFEKDIDALFREKIEKDGAYSLAKGGFPKRELEKDQFVVKGNDITWISYIVLELSLAIKSCEFSGELKEVLRNAGSEMAIELWKDYGSAGLKLPPNIEYKDDDSLAETRKKDKDSLSSLAKDRDKDETIFDNLIAELAGLGV